MVADILRPRWSHVLTSALGKRTPRCGSASTPRSAPRHSLPPLAPRREIAARLAPAPGAATDLASLGPEARPNDPRHVADGAQAGDETSAQAMFDEVVIQLLEACLQLPPATPPPLIQRGAAAGRLNARRRRQPGMQRRGALLGQEQEVEQQQQQLDTSPMHEQLHPHSAGRPASRMAPRRSGSTAARPGTKELPVSEAASATNDDIASPSVGSGGARLLQHASSGGGQQVFVMSTRLDPARRRSAYRRQVASLLEAERRQKRQAGAHAQLAQLLERLHWEVDDDDGENEKESAAFTAAADAVGSSKAGHQHQRRQRGSANEEAAWRHAAERYWEYRAFLFVRAMEARIARAERVAGGRRSREGHMGRGALQAVQAVANATPRLERHDLMQLQDIVMHCRRQLAAASAAAAEGTEPAAASCPSVSSLSCTLPWSSSSRSCVPPSGPPTTAATAGSAALEPRQAAVAGWLERSARGLLARYHWPLVMRLEYSLTGRLPRRQWHRREDVLLRGLLALHEAAACCSFPPGVAFSTYAEYVARGAMRRRLDLQRCADAGDVPRYMLEVLAQARRAARRAGVDLEEELERISQQQAVTSTRSNPAARDSAASTAALQLPGGFSTKKVLECLSFLGRSSLSVEGDPFLDERMAAPQPSSSSTGAHLGKAAPAAGRGASSFDLCLAATEVTRAVRRLPRPQRQALCAHYGLDVGSESDSGDGDDTAGGCSEHLPGNSSAAGKSGSCKRVTSSSSSSSSSAPDGDGDGSSTGGCNGDDGSSAVSSREDESLGYVGLDGPGALPGYTRKSSREVAQQLGTSRGIVDSWRKGALQELRQSRGLVALLHEVLPGKPLKAQQQCDGGGVGKGTRRNRRTRHGQVGMQGAAVTGGEKKKKRGQATAASVGGKKNGEKERGQQRYGK